MAHSSPQCGLGWKENLGNFCCKSECWKKINGVEKASTVILREAEPFFSLKHISTQT